MKFNYPQAVKQQQAIQQAQSQIASKIQPQQHSIQQHAVQQHATQQHAQQHSGLSNISPSLIQGQQAERVPLGSSFGSRPNAIVSPTKGPNPSFVSGNSIKPTEIPVGSVGHAVSKSNQGLSTHQYGGQVSGLGTSSSIEAKFRGQVVSGGNLHSQNWWLKNIMPGYIDVTIIIRSNNVFYL